MGNYVTFTGILKANTVKPDWLSLRQIIPPSRSVMVLLHAKPKPMLSFSVLWIP